jgi:hypothetical protein
MHLVACSFGWWLMTGADLFWDKSTAGWLLVAGLFWEKSTVAWWLISQANRALVRTVTTNKRAKKCRHIYTYQSWCTRVQRSPACPWPGSRHGFRLLQAHPLLARNPTALLCNPKGWKNSQELNINVTELCNIIHASVAHTESSRMLDVLKSR